MDPQGNIINEVVAHPGEHPYYVVLFFLFIGAGVWFVKWLNNTYTKPDQERADNIIKQKQATIDKIYESSQTQMSKFSGEVIKELKGINLNISDLKIEFSATNANMENFKDQLTEYRDMLENINTKIDGKANLGDVEILRSKADELSREITVLKTKIALFEKK